MKITKLSFPDKATLKGFWKKAWNILKQDISQVEYPDSISANNQISWDEWNDLANEMKTLNEELLGSIHNKSGVYGIFTRDNAKSKWSVKYVGHTKYAKQRIVNHLFNKHEKTGAKLSNVKSTINSGKQIGISFVEIKPAELRRYVEMMIIKKEQPDWCRHGKIGAVASSKKKTITRKSVVLIACVKTQLPFRAPANELFTSPLFRYSLRYAETLNPDHIFVLSARYGLLELDDVVDPYDVAMNQKTPEEREDWCNGVLEQLREKCDLKRDEFVILAGVNYRECLIDHMKYVEIPMEGLNLGRQLYFMRIKL